MRRPMSPAQRWLWMAAGPLLLLALWGALQASGLVTSRLLPSPARTLAALWGNGADGGLAADFAHTLLRTLRAFAIGAALGVPLGIVVGASERLYRAIEFPVDFFRSTPATALFPLCMIVFGLGDVAKIAVAAFAAWLIVLFNVAYGVMNARQTRVLAVRAMGASWPRVLRDVLFYEALPQTFVGLRSAVSLALVVIVVAEMFIGSDDGLGKRIIDDQIIFDLPGLYATILATGVLGYGLNMLFLFAERRLVHWAGR